MKLTNVDRNTLYWLAGILEREGSFMVVGFEKQEKATYPVIINVGMTDYDIIKKIADIWHISPYKFDSSNTDYKPVYKLKIFGYKALKWMKKLYPLMGKRRQKQIEKCFEALNLSINDKIPKLPNTHKLTPKQVKTIRKRYKYGDVSQRQLARKYSVALLTIQRIIKRETYKWVKEYTEV